MRSRPDIPLRPTTRGQNGSIELAGDVRRLEALPRIDTRPRRHHGTQLALLGLVILLGLASRRYADAIPLFIARYAGDTLWATAAYLALGVVWPNARIGSLAVGAALISLAVELSQLAHPVWLQSVRRWPGAGLLLGYDFVASDLVCYAVGVALGVALDYGSRLARR